MAIRSSSARAAATHMTATEAIAASFDASGLTDIYLNEGTPYRSRLRRPHRLQPPRALGRRSGHRRSRHAGQRARAGRASALRRTSSRPAIGAAFGSTCSATIATSRSSTRSSRASRRPAMQPDANQRPAARRTGQGSVQRRRQRATGLRNPWRASQATDSPGGADVDVYSFRGTAGTTVWLDIDRTSTSLDSVVELVDANGAVIARSDNSLDESSNPALLVGSAKRLQSGTDAASPLFAARFLFDQSKRRRHARRVARHRRQRSARTSSGSAPAARI